jgi:uncharacterized protein (TIGR00725 family)
MMKNSRYKICVSGAFETPDIPLQALQKAKSIGQAIGKRGHFLLTGSHHGFPLYSAMGAKDVGGEVIYFSPASKHSEHVEVYRLDTNHADMIIYTGFGHTGNQIFLSRSADAVIIGCGKLDALHEFTLALKENKPVGVLLGDWKVDEIIKKMSEDQKISHQPIVFENDPDKLVEKLLEMVIKK